LSRETSHATLVTTRRKGIGAQLVKKGVEYLRGTECPFVIVLGHPEYYPRFGFEIASQYGIRCQWEGVPDEAFMILWLDKSMINRASGVARYQDEFNEAM
jgi:putative acetyltransferase